MSELEHELFLFVVEDNGTGEEAASTWDRRVACGPGCRKGWWKGFRSCCPPPAKPEMNWRVWSMLTADLLERVLERLPASSQARSQVVCKKWRSLLTSPAFLHRSASVAVSSGLSPCVVWDTTQGSLESLQQSVFPRLQRLRLDVLCDYIWEYDGSWFDDHVFTGVRKGGAEDRRRPRCNTYHIWCRGLVCVYYEGANPLGVHICVVNPVNRTWVELPYLAVPSPPMTRLMVVPGRDSHFQLMVMSIRQSGCKEHEACESCWLWCVATYCSRTGAWSPTTSAQCEPFPNMEAVYLVSGSHLIVNGLLYLVLGDPSNLLVLNAEDGKVVRRLIGVARVGDGGSHGWGNDGYRAPFEILVEHKGDVYCVACNNHACSIWKLEDISNPQWTLVSSFDWVWTATQTSWTADLDYPDLFSAMVIGNRIFVSFRGNSLFIPNGDVLLAYNIPSGKWKTISSEVSRMLFAPMPGLHLPNFVN